MADLGNDGFLPFTPTGSDGRAVGLTGSDAGGGDAFGLVVRPIGGPFDVNVVSGSVSITGTFMASNADVVAVLTSSEAKLCDLTASSDLALIALGDITASIDQQSIDLLHPLTASLEKLCVLTASADTSIILLTDISSSIGSIGGSTPAGSSAVTKVSSSITNVTLLAVNTARLGASIHNDSRSRLYLKLGATATTASFTIRMAPEAHYEIPFSYTGIIDGIWAPLSSSFARVTEFTA